jgi:hypothetical protein
MICAIAIGGGWYALCNSPLDSNPFVSGESIAGGFEQRQIVWHSNDYEWKKKMPLTITGRRLDGPSAPRISDYATNTFVPGKGSFIVSGVTLPTLGCWKITGHYNSQELSQDLTIVVKIGLILRANLNHNCQVFCSR